MLIILHLYELKLLFRVLHKFLSSVYSVAKFTHTEKGNLMPRRRGEGGVAAPGDMPCLLWIFPATLINLGIPSDHALSPETVQQI